MAATTSPEGGAAAASSPITPAPSTRGGVAGAGVGTGATASHSPHRQRRHRRRSPGPIAATARVFAVLSISILTGRGGVGISSEVVVATETTTTMAFAGLRAAGRAGVGASRRRGGAPWNFGHAYSASSRPSVHSNGAIPSPSPMPSFATTPRTSSPPMSWLRPGTPSPSALLSRLYASTGGNDGDDGKDPGYSEAPWNSTSASSNIGAAGNNPYADLGSEGDDHRENSYPDPDRQRLERVDVDENSVDAGTGAGERDDWDVVDSAMFASASAGGVAAFGERGTGLNATIPGTAFSNDTASSGAEIGGVINGDEPPHTSASTATAGTEIIPPADEIRPPEIPSPPSSPPNSTDEDADDAGTVQSGTGQSEGASAAEDDALSIHPHSIEILPVSLSDEEEQSKRDATSKFLKSSYGMYPFVNMFRGSAMYIARHRNTVMVYHVSGELLEWDGFPNLINDIALTWLLGTRVVIVIGCRCFVDRRLRELGRWPPERHGGVRVTDETVLRIVKEEAGFVRFEVERQLARAVRQGSYFASSSSSDDKGSGMPNVVSGNFYSAQPFGIVDGVDHQYTGILRRVEKDKIRQAHDANDIVLLTNLGVSPSGELFNVNSESLASGVAGALEANKIVFFALAGTELRDVETGKMIMSLRQSDARRLLEYNGLTVRRGGYTVFDSDTEHHPAVIETLLKIGWSLHALQNGVKRAHIIPPVNGALLQELYTRDGAGTLVSRDIYEGIRRANVNDVAGIFDLIQPLVKMGTLAVRTRTTLEKDILSYFVYTRDNLIVACGQLHRFEGGYAEIGCLVVNRDYRSQGRGDAMLGYLERLCVQSGALNVFVLSTQTMQFFVERGFREVGVDSLPPSRRATYNHARRSKIYLKRITDDRDLDADELLWDR